MKSGILLSLDLSTNSTGWAIFDIKSKRLLKYGVIKPKVPGISKMQYPEAALYKILDISIMVGDLIDTFQPDIIIVEEINRGINRISQKSLDALHFFVFDQIRIRSQELLKSLILVDSNGAKGWRNALGLKLSEEDKEYNKEARKYNKNNKLKKPLIDWKVLAQWYVNDRYNTSFDVVENTSDSDVCDAIAMASSFLKDI